VMFRTTAQFNHVVTASVLEEHGYVFRLQNVCEEEHYVGLTSVLRTEAGDSCETLVTVYSRVQITM
jgi:hypothetical protein